MFLAFCIEFKRFYNFYLDENKSKFETFLPLQLDATCNGFKHMALLSNKSDLFKQLNLISSDASSDPNDFYNFLLYKVINICEQKKNK